MKKIIILLITITLLAIPSCNKMNDLVNNKSSTNNSNSVVEESGEFEDVYWQDTLAAISFLGFNQYDDLHTYSESQEFIEYLEFFFPSIKEFEIIDAGGDELYFIIPRFNKSNLRINRNNFTGEEDFEEEEFYNGKAKPILLQTNVGDIYPETEIFISYGNQDILFFPYLSGEDSTIILPRYGIMDLTMYDMEEDIGYEKNIFLLEGTWNCEYYDAQNKKNNIDLQFENFQSSNSEDWFEMIYWKATEDDTLRGNCYFRVPIDFWEEIDDEEILLYFDLAGQKNGELNLLFGKFDFEFKDYDTLILKHVGYDPLNKGEENFEYEFHRSFG